MMSFKGTVPGNNEVFNPDEFTDRELLVHVYRTVLRLDKAIFGNGQPGLADRVAKVEGAIPPRAATIGGLSGFFAAVTAVVLDVFFRARVGH